jgi:serine acetyltransferase
MKTAIFSLSLVAALMTGGAHAQTTTLIGPGTGAGDDIKNGGFESGSTGSYPDYTVVSDWFNAGGGAGVIAAGNDRERTGTYGGSVALTVVGASSPAVNTGHTIAAGDTFSLTFYHGRAEDWDADDTIGVFLYSTAGVIWTTTVSPTNNALTGNFDLFTVNNISVPAANIGETLFLRFVSNASLNEYAAVDDVTLEVTAGGPLPPNPVLIGPGTGAGDDIKNGGFESIGGTGTYRPYTVISDWFNYGGNAAVIVAGADRKRTGTFGGSVAIPGDGVSSPAVNTGHTIAAGETFSLTFYYGYCENWDVGTDKINVVLYSTAGVIWSDVVTPSQNALSGNFTQFTTNKIPAANIGETLLLRFEPDAVVGEFAAIDDVTLEFTKAPPRGTLVSFF